MRQAIITKYVGPTDTRGSRIRCTANAGSRTFDWDHALDPEDNHRVAALSYASELGWLARNSIHGGSMPNSEGYAFVLVEKVRP